ncbi:MAG TPA: hypothetical protein VK797_07360 [Tepidisphaeraceae bacterium]|jgi:hypothetical protein|nr:hypothetical protein [Tepidisphaeraceae bacterium]
MTVGPLPQNELRTKLLELAALFNELADIEVPEPAVGNFTAVDVAESILRQKARQDDRTRFDKASDEAGQVLIDLVNSKLLDDRQLRVLVAAYETRSWGELLQTKSNLFALCVGKSPVELRNRSGQTQEYELIGDDTSPSLQLPSAPETLRQRVERTLRTPQAVNRQRCRQYADFCQSLATAIPVEKQKPKRARGEPTKAAILQLMDHPDWSVSRIAQEIGCSHTTLYRSKRFMAAWEAHNATLPPKGFKTRGRGGDHGLEASDDND